MDAWAHKMKLVCPTLTIDSLKFIRKLGEHLIRLSKLGRSDLFLHQNPMAPYTFAIVAIVKIG
jgi:hypothetical protein